MEKTWKLILALIVIAMTGTGPALAAKVKAAQPDKAVSGEPVGLLFNGVLSGQYEMKMSSKNSLALRAGLGGRSFGTNYSYFTFMAGGMYRFWPMKTAMREWYWGPAGQVFIMSMKWDNPFGTDDSSSGFGLGVGAEGGYQHIFDSGFLLDGSIGVQAVLGNLSVGSGAYEMDVPMGGFFPYLRAGIGYAWK